MAKLSRKTMKLFGQNAVAGQISSFGGYAAGSITNTTDPDVIQSLANYLGGWFSAIVGSNSPVAQDMNALCYLFAYQLKYIFEEGMPEWDVSSTYYTGGMVQSSGAIYVSLTDSNTGNAVTDSTKWTAFSNRLITSSSASPTSVGGATPIPSNASRDEDIYVSGNNSTWTARTAAAANTWNDVTWVPAFGYFIAVSSSGASRIMYSYDGITWNSVTAAEANSWSKIIYAPGIGLLVSVSIDGTHRVQYSSTGASWSTATASAANQWASLAWSPTLRLLCAVASTGTNRVMTSPDATTWTGRTEAEANSWQDIVWSPGLALFCAVSPDGTHRIQYSADGITWGLATAPEANSWRSICWSVRLGIFCAVSSDGTNRVMTSPDGLNWTARAAAEANQWFRVAYSEEWGIFVAVSRNGTNRVMTSPDGIVWTAVAAAEANSWNGVAWSPAKRIWAAVSQDGTDRVMTLAPTAISASPQIASAVKNGKRLTIVGSSDSAAVILTDNALLPIRNDIYITKNQTVTFRYDSVQDIYIRVSG